MPIGQPDLEDPSLKLSSQVIVDFIECIIKTNHDTAIQKKKELNQLTLQNHANLSQILNKHNNTQFA